MLADLRQQQQGVDEEIQEIQRTIEDRLEPLRKKKLQLETAIAGLQGLTSLDAPKTDTAMASTQAPPVNSNGASADASHEPPADSTQTPRRTRGPGRKTLTQTDTTSKRRSSEDIIHGIPPMMHKFMRVNFRSTPTKYPKDLESALRAVYGDRYETFIITIPEGRGKRIKRTLAEDVASEKSGIRSMLTSTLVVFNKIADDPATKGRYQSAVHNTMGAINFGNRRKQIAETLSKWGVATS